MAQEYGAEREEEARASDIDLRVELRKILEGLDTEDQAVID